MYKRQILGWSYYAESCVDYLFGPNGIIPVSYTHLDVYKRQGTISLPEGTEMRMPGDNVEMDVELITPISIEVGLRFAIREGCITVGSGAVIAINE